jgi:PAS domain S-box-containing protein
VVAQMQSLVRTEARPIEFLTGASQSWKVLLGALLVGVAYFTAARLGLALLAQPEGVAIFWPASGIAAGALLLIGDQRRLAVVLGVFFATLAANLLGDRNLLLAVVFGLCNAGEALLFAGVIGITCGSANVFGKLRSTIWFFVAAFASAAAMAAMAALAIRLVKGPVISWFDVWQAWWWSDAAGIIMFAPILMTFVGIVSDPPAKRQWILGLTLLSLLLVVTGFTYYWPPQQAESWMPVPMAGIFPLLLLIAARCRPAFLAAGLMLVAVAIVWAATQGLGRLGNPDVVLADRIYGARLTLLSIAFCGLVFVAVMTERRTVENTLRANDERFSRLADSAPGMICSFRVDKEGNYAMPFASRAIESILALRQVDVRHDATAIVQRIHPEDFTWIELELLRSRDTLCHFNIEYRYAHPTKGEIWLESFSAPVREADGTVMWHGFVQDITRRKSSEVHIKRLMGELNHRAKNLLSVVQAVAHHTAREGSSALFLETFGKRMKGLAASHDLLMGSGWEGVEITELVQSQLAHFNSFLGSRITLSGPALRLKPTAAQIIGMALHELSTNAAKYGALSGDSGSVDITWTGGDDFKICWIEKNGKPVEQPVKRGFGYEVMVAMPEHQLDAAVRLATPVSGLVWELSAPKEQTLDIDDGVVASQSKEAL